MLDVKGGLLCAEATLAHPSILTAGFVCPSESGFLVPLWRRTYLLIPFEVDIRFAGGGDGRAAKMSAREVLNVEADMLSPRRGLWTSRQGMLSPPRSEGC